MRTMLRIDCITLFPEMLSALECGITGRALDKKHVQLTGWNPRDYTPWKHGIVDDRPYGGGPGMVLGAEPLARTLDAIKATDTKRSPHVIFLSPAGTRLTQQAIPGLVQQEWIVLVMGRYEGIDERFIVRHVDALWSIGDYVLSGGELPGMVLIDCMIRTLPGALGHADSADQDSFSDGGLLDWPHYTKPRVYEGLPVPEVLVNGNHAEITAWKKDQALQRTRKLRPDLVEQEQKRSQP